MILSQSHHFTPENVGRLLTHADIAHRVLRTGAGSRLLIATPATPAARLLVSMLAFTYSRPHDYWYRAWRADA